MQRALTQPAQTIGLNFTAATVGNVLNGVGFNPNQSGWVGPEQYILMSYNIIRSFNKFTGQPDGILILIPPVSLVALPKIFELIIAVMPIAGL